MNLVNQRNDLDFQKKAKYYLATLEAQKQLKSNALQGYTESVHKILDKIKQAEYVEMVNVRNDTLKRIKQHMNHQVKTKMEIWKITQRRIYHVFVSFTRKFN